MDFKEKKKSMHFMFSSKELCHYNNKPVHLIIKCNVRTFPTYTSNDADASMITYFVCNHYVYNVSCNEVFGTEQCLLYL